MRIILIFLIACSAPIYAQKAEKLTKSGGIYFAGGFYQDTLSVSINNEPIIEKRVLKTIANLGCVPISFSFFCDKETLYFYHSPDDIYKVSMPGSRYDAMKIEINGTIIPVSIEKDSYYIIEKKDSEYRLEKSSVEPGFY